MHNNKELINDSTSDISKNDFSITKVENSINNTKIENIDYSKGYIDFDNETIIRINKQMPIVYACKCIGSSHIRENKPCQDAFKIWTQQFDGKQAIILSISDGHGSEKYDLSEYGSKIATEAIVDELVKFYESYLENKTELGQEFDMFKILKSDFPQKIIRHWKEKVIEHYQKKFKSVDGIINENERKDIIKRYGATAMFAFIIPEGVFLGQIGDGDLVVVNDKSVERPLPISDELIANVTYSMTSENAHFLWNMDKISIDSKTILMLSTDGLSNAYSDDENFFRFVRSLYDNLIDCRETKDIKELNIPDFIKNASVNGSGDDITIAFVIIDPKIIL